MNPDEVYRLALELYGDPVEARIAAAQMQLETGGGSAMPGNNLFGIKGPGQSLRTMESVGGEMVPQTASFRTYTDPRASIVDRLRFLQTNPRYAEAGYFDATTPEEKADALQRAGYATDPNYAAKLKSIMSGGRPMIYDASDFPQFALGGMGLVPVSAQPPAPAGVLGMTPAQPLLGPTQPQSLLDRFAPGSGYGYDVALGIANTPGGPMTALAGGFAHAKDMAFERQMGEANLQLARAQLTGPTAAMRNYEYLVSQNVDPTVAREAAFGGGQGPVFNIGQQPGTQQYGSVPSGYTRKIDAQGRAIDMPNPGTEAYEKRQQAKRTSDSAITAIKRLQDLVAEHGEGLSLIGDPSIKLEMGTLYEEILAALGVLSNTGVMDAHEVERLKGALPDPREKFTFASGEDIKKAYDVLLQRIYRVKGEEMPETTQGGSQKATHRFNSQTGEIEPSP